MSRRAATLSLLLGLVCGLALSVPAMAKTGTEARLDTTLRRDATPGSTIAVAWSLFQVVDDRESPFSSPGVYMRLTGVDGKDSTEVVGTETPSGSGHYEAMIQVPASGIGDVVVGLKGEQCTAADGCSRMDIVFPLTDDRLVVGSARSVAPPVAPGSPSASSMSAQLVPLMVIGIAVGVAVGVVALILGRRVAFRPSAGR
jgi:hypothetical protein